jgi:hypothetical protein
MPVGPARPSWYNRAMGPASRLARELVRPFLFRGRPAWSVVLAFAAINGIVFVNAILHDPRVGYDSNEHLVNIAVLSELRLVTRQDTQAFYYSPLPYILPALMMHATGVKLFWAAKFAQLLNLALSLGLTHSLLRACRLVSPHPALRLGTLLGLGILPVYYKSFAFVRGEPYVAFFATAALYYVVEVFVRRRFRVRGIVFLGLAIGLSGLSRQWGILLLPALGVFGAFEWLRLPRWRGAIARSTLLALAVGSLVGFSFYGVQKLRFGSMATFNRRPAPCFTFANQPLDFYFGLGLDQLFDEPIRPNFANQFLPIFYSETWGDYWGHFAVYGVDTRTPEFVGVRYLANLRPEDEPPWLVTNFPTIGPYLGRVNLLALLPTGLALAAVLMAGASVFRRRAEPRRRELATWVLLAVAASWCGYAWFLIMFPSIGRGDTIKATYMLHTFPYVAILTGVLLERLRGRMPFVYRFLIGSTVLIWIHHLPVMVTHSSLHRLLPLG